MQILNILFPQLDKALDFNLKDDLSLRVSLILLDNFIEVLLKYSIESNSKIREEKSHAEILNKAIRNHNNLLKISKKIELIDNNDFQILSYCHKIRNIQYHRPFLCNELTYNDYNTLIKFAVVEILKFIIKYQDKYIVKPYQKIKEFDPFNTYFKFDAEEIIEKLNRIQIIDTTNLLINQLELKIDEIISFYESYANENWSEFNNLTSSSYIEYVSLIGGFNMKKIACNKLTSKSFTSFQNKVNSLDQFETGDAIKYYYELSKKLDSILLGISYHIIKDESLNS